MSSPYELFKTCLMTLLVPLRVLATLILLAAYAGVCRLAAVGLSQEDTHLVFSSPWRRGVLTVGPFLCRLSWLLSLGCWVRYKGDMTMVNSKGVKAQIIVSNHVSYMDVNAFMAVMMPTPGFVAKKAIFQIPLIAACARVWGCVAVDREKSVGSSVVEQLELRVKHPELNQVVVFPEATTSNGRFLTHFHRGAFVPGAPVKPVVLRYQHKNFNPAWESVYAPYHLFRFMTQFVNYCDITFLPVYTPSEAERADAGLFANNVREAMSRATGLPLSDSDVQDKKDYLALLRGGPAKLE
jgi:lysophosphatidylcholine acyltransferase/lyso-PAF acetyltransferase